MINMLNALKKVNTVLELEWGQEFLEFLEFDCSMSGCTVEIEGKEWYSDGDEVLDKLDFSKIAYINIKNNGNLYTITMQDNKKITITSH